MVIYKGYEDPELGDNSESSQNVQQHIGIHPQALIRHFKLIVNNKKQQIQLEMSNLKKKKQLLFPYRAPIEPL